MCRIASLLKPCVIVTTRPFKKRCMDLVHHPARCDRIRPIPLKLSCLKPTQSLFPRHIKKHNMREQRNQRVTPTAKRPREHPVIVLRKLSFKHSQPILNRSFHRERHYARCPVHIISVNMPDTKSLRQRAPKRTRPRARSTQNVHTKRHGRKIIEKAPRRTQGFQGSILKQWGNQPLIPLTFTAV